MSRASQPWPLVFLLLLFLLLALGSFLWTRQVRESYVAPNLEVENKLPNPFTSEWKKPLEAATVEESTNPECK